MQLSNAAYEAIKDANFRYRDFRKKLPKADLLLIEKAKRITAGKYALLSDDVGHDPATCTEELCYSCIVVYRHPEWKKAAKRLDTVTAELKKCAEKTHALRDKISTCAPRERKAVLDELESVEKRRVSLMKIGSTILDEAPKEVR